MNQRSRKATAVFCTASFVLLVTAALALAAPAIRGTTGDDTLTGTDVRDRIRAYSGNDTVDAKAGRDRIAAGRDNDTVEAGPGRDLVFSGYGDDTVNGGPGNDLIFAQRGVDTVSGGEGSDELWALARKDVTKQPNEPTDTLDGGPGHDLIRVRDGEADKVTCGPGVDRVRADYKDQVANDCEHVNRSRPRKRDEQREKDDD
jgi:Ca2+-binding RTX toxin-like protein